MFDEQITNEEQKEIDDAKTVAAEAHEKVLDHAEENLAALRNEPTLDESESESTSEQSEEEQTDESKDTDESTSKKTDESESKDESTSEESSDTGQTDDVSDSKADENALTQAEVRAAIHNGWSQEDIDELAEANPGLAKKTCAKALETQNNLSTKFSELGKTQAAAPVVPAVPVTPTAKPEPKSIDFTALRTQYENDPIVDILEQVVNQSQAQATELGTLRETGPKAEAAVDAAQAQKDAAISQQIDTFFDKPEVTAYKDTYGEVEKGSRDWDGLTQGQIKKRYEVAEQANLIMLGAQQQGVEMSLDEAFERGHLLVTKDAQEAAIRKTIKAKAVKRSKGITLEPTNSKKVPDTGKKTVAKAEANAGRLLRKLFGS